MVENVSLWVGARPGGSRPRPRRTAVALAALLVAVVLLYCSLAGLSWWHRARASAGGCAGSEPAGPRGCPPAVDRGTDAWAASEADPQRQHGAPSSAGSAAEQSAHSRREGEHAASSAPGSLPGGRAASVAAADGTAAGTAEAAAAAVPPDSPDANDGGAQGRGIADAPAAAAAVPRVALLFLLQGDGLLANEALWAAFLEQAAGMELRRAPPTTAVQAAVQVDLAALLPGGSGGGGGGLKPPLASYDELAYQGYAQQHVVPQGGATPPPRAAAKARVVDAASNSSGAQQQDKGAQPLPPGTPSLSSPSIGHSSSTADRGGRQGRGAAAPGVAWGGRGSGSDASADERGRELEEGELPAALRAASARLVAELLPSCAITCTQAGAQEGGGGAAAAADAGGACSRLGCVPAVAAAQAASSAAAELELRQLLAEEVRRILFPKAGATGSATGDDDDDDPAAGAWDGSGRAAPVWLVWLLAWVRHAGQRRQELLAGGARSGSFGGVEVVAMAEAALRRRLALPPATRTNGGRPLLGMREETGRGLAEGGSWGRGARSWLRRAFGVLREEQERRGLAEAWLRLSCGGGTGPYPGGGVAEAAACRGALAGGGWRRFFSLYAHLSDPSVAAHPGGLLCSAVVASSVNTSHGYAQHALVQAELVLLAAALADPLNARFVLLSETSIPVRPRPRDKVISHILNYVHTDAACCLYEESAVARRQKQPLPPAVLSACAAYLTPHKQLGVHPCHTPFRPCPVLPALPARLGMSLYHVFVPILSGLQADLGWRFLMSASIAGSAQTDELVEGTDCLGEAHYADWTAGGGWHPRAFLPADLHPTDAAGWRRSKPPDQGLTDPRTPPEAPHGSRIRGVGRGAASSAPRSEAAAAAAADGDDAGDVEAATTMRAWLELQGYVPLGHRCHLFARKFPRLAAPHTFRFAMSCPPRGLGLAPWCAQKGRAPSPPPG
ncbi:hypothetical protein TSOC_002363 [Tetrabaena socialis]|uniref:Uncharacterized protein n=1 Tax=Tetrabaena socialis TaxID=47790 RepID=A0A2J8AE94_9CHLO|nr:hypothetical protein TSOC_002363 [Tetrabaena socialis]|eukprot:PNH10834.1 hypothetical protein TSOC_002363 [Tetrabaena socialis]